VRRTRGFMHHYMTQPLVELYGGSMVAVKASRCGITRRGTCTEELAGASFFLAYGCLPSETTTTTAARKGAGGGEGE
jgi:hypothetical protein